MDRRRFLLASGAAFVVACSSDGDDVEPSSIAPDSTAASGSTNLDPTTSAAAGGVPRAALAVADFDGVGTCELLPESTAGPFPLEEQFIRSDVTEGYPGHGLRLGLRLVDEACRPIPDAAVEIWHCDATGDYSAFADGGTGKDEAEGTTFLRGTQLADDDGIVEFATIYPGWYPGRAVHIHLRVHVNDQIVRTGQLYFDDADTEAVYAEAPYTEFGPPDTRTADDRIPGALISLRQDESATLGLVNLGVAR